MSRTSPLRKAAALTATLAGLTVALAATLTSTAAAEPVAPSPDSVTHATAPSTTWFVDPRTPKQRRAQIAVPANPKKYRGKLRETRAVYRAKDGSLAVPIKTSVGHRLVKGQAVTLDGDGLFARNSPKLTGAAKVQLRKLATSLSDATAIRCEGYTDHSGSKARNRVLSAKRAAAVCGSLVALTKGVQATKVGYGSTRPAVVGGTVAQRKLNRRVVIEMTGAKAPVPSAPQARVPGAPELVDLDAVRGGVFYAFRAPASDGGSPITGYQVSIGGAWTAVSSSPRRQPAPRACLADCGDDLIRGDLWELAAGTQVALRVRAVNQVGAGAPSNVLNAVVPSLPSAPRDLVASVDGTTVTLTFADPASDGNATIWGYEARIDDGTWSSVTPLDNTIVLTGQSVGTHTYQLRAVNTVGSGAEATSNVVTVAAPGPQVSSSFYYFSMGQVSAWVTFSSVADAQGYEARLDGGAWLSVDVLADADGTVAGLVQDPVCTVECTQDRTIEVRALTAAGPTAASAPVTSRYEVLG